MRRFTYNDPSEGVGFPLMSEEFTHLLRHGFLGGVLLLLVSCTGVSSNARLEQSSDMITGGGNLALTAVRATAVAAVRQPVTTTKLGLVVLWHRPHAAVSGNLPVDLIPQTVATEAPGTPEFEELLDREGFPRAESGTLKWLVDGPEFFSEFDRQISSARYSIQVQVFIFDNDDIAVRYADLLKGRSGEVPVQVLFDDLGSTFAHTSAPRTLGPRGFVPPSDMHSYLRKNSKIRVRRTLNPWLVCDHTKLLVFDQRTAILGGMNIGREYFSEWHDLMVAVEGPVVRTLSDDFNSAWKKSGPWGDFALLHKSKISARPEPVTDITGGIPLRVLRTDPAKGRYEILDASLLAIRGARRRVWIQTPYFAHDDIKVEVAAAARRGVDVRVIIPSAGDSAIMSAGNLGTANSLIQAGAKVFRYPKMTHLKALICDDWATVGSANIDTLSMRINRELNLAFSNRAAVRDLEKLIFLPDFQRSKRIRLEETQSIIHSVAEIIAGQL